MTNTNPGVAFAGEPTNRHLPPLLDCTPPAPSTHNDSSFRANLASTLAALPSIVAASSKGLATLESADAGSGRAFARGGCLGMPGSSSWAGACLECLNAAARVLAGGACRGSRRAGAWRDGCFMAYADTYASSGREDAFHGWFYAGSNAPLVLAERGECMVDAAAYCKRCIDDSLRGAPPLGWLWRLRGRGGGGQLHLLPKHQDIAEQQDSERVLDPTPSALSTFRLETWGKAEILIKIWYSCSDGQILVLVYDSCRSSDNRSVILLHHRHSDKRTSLTGTVNGDTLDASEPWV